MKNNYWCYTFLYEVLLIRLPFSRRKEDKNSCHCNDFSLSIKRIYRAKWHIDPPGLHLWPQCNSELWLRQITLIYKEKNNVDTQVTFYFYFFGELVCCRRQSMVSGHN